MNKETRTSELSPVSTQQAKLAERLVNDPGQKSPDQSSQKQKKINVRGSSAKSPPTNTYPHPERGGVETRRRRLKHQQSSLRGKVKQATKQPRDKVGELKPFYLPRQKNLQHTVGGTTQAKGRLLRGDKDAWFATRQSMQTFVKVWTKPGHMHSKSSRIILGPGCERNAT